MYSAISRNKLNTVLIIALFLVILGALGALAAWLTGEWWIAAAVLGGAAIYATFQYFMADKQTLALTGAQGISKQDAPELFRMVEQVGGQDRREMLGGGGGRQRVGRFNRFDAMHARRGALGPLVHQAIGGQLFIEQRMDAAMGRFLADEALQFLLPERALVFRQQRNSALDRADEEVFTDGEAKGKRGEECGLERIAIDPVPGHGRFEVYQ